MEELKTKVADLADHTGDVLDTYYRLAVIKFTKKSAKIATAVITLFVISAFALCVFVFIGVGLAIWLGTYMNAALAYFIVAAFYLVLIGCFWGLRRKLVFPLVRDFLVRKIYD
jgi:uncharacterized membrane protein YqjE